MNKTMKLHRIIVALGCPLGLAAPLLAQTCNANMAESTPTAEFTDHGNGTVTHSRTGLMWKRCAEGQSWNAGSCTTLSPGAVSWADALLAARQATFAGYTDWRLPNVKELKSIVEDKCYSPSINTSIFPNTPASSFWSASAYAGYSGYAWYVNFGYGFAGVSVKSGADQVRLVRAGQSFGSFDADDIVPLTVSKTGAGSVTGAGISCGSTCSGKAGRDFQVTLTATPAANLTTWGGACAHAGAQPTCTLTMDMGKTVSASFAEAPIVTFAPASQSFGLQNIGSTSAAQSVTLSNTGTTALVIGSVTPQGDFAVTANNCPIGPSALPVAGSCTLGIRFSPTASGARTGSVLIYSNTPGSPHSIALTGTGQGAALSISTTSLNFSGQYTGTTSTAQTITLSNVGGAAVNFTSIAVFSDFGRTTTCGPSLAPGANCTVSVSFAPTAAVSYLGSLVINSDAVASPHTVSLSGTGLATPGVALSPASLTFDSQRQGSPSAAKTITLLNSGTATLTLIGSGISGISASGDFGVSHNCGTGPAAGASCTIYVVFTPTALGSRTGSVSISSNAIGGARTVGLSGTGLSAATPVCTLVPAPPSVRKNGAARLTASCTPAATSYNWSDGTPSGGTCAAAHVATCDVTPAATTTYTVTGVNASGPGPTVSATVKVSSDLTPILMLLLD